MRQVVSLRTRRLLSGVALAAASFALSPLATAAELNLYTTREPALILPLLQSFTQDTGVAVNTVFVKDGLIERVKAEGDKSPADILMTVDIGNLLDLVESGVTQPVDSAVLKDAIPAHLRGEDGSWFALSMRDRVAYVAADMDEVNTLTYEDFADPRWKGKVCIRSGQHPYKTSACWRP